MIDKKELRIGNLINVFSTGGKFNDYITEAKSHDITRCEEESFKYWNYKPIPLTEDWLVKLGFKKTNESKDVEWYNLNGFDVAIDEEYGKVYFVYQHLVLKHILSVHQFQNLYYALTNKELNYER